MYVSVTVFFSCELCSFPISTAIRSPNLSSIQRYGRYRLGLWRPTIETETNGGSKIMSKKKVPYEGGRTDGKLHHHFGRNIMAGKNNNAEISEKKENKKILK